MVTNPLQMAMSGLFPGPGGNMISPEALAHARNMGLLGIGTALMEAGGPSREKVSMGQALARGLQGGMGMYNQAMQGGLQQAMMGHQIQAQQQQQAIQQQRMGMEEKRFGMEEKRFGLDEQRLQQQAQEQAQKNQALQQYLGSVPEPDRNLAAIAPDEYVAAQLKSRTPDLPSGMVMGPNGPQWVPGYLEGQKAVRAAGAPRLSVNNMQEREESKTVGKFFGDLYTDVQKGAVQATQQDSRLDRLNGLLDQVDTGKFTGTVQELKKAAKGVGIDLEAMGIKDDVAPAEAAAALSSEIALQLRNPAGGAGMPGAMSDQDRAFLAGMVPGLETTPEGRRAMIDTNKKLNQRSREVAKMATAYRKKTGQLDDGFMQQLQQHAEKNPLFAGQQMPAAPTVAAPTARAPAAPDPANPWATKSDEEVLNELRRKGLLK